MYQLPAGNSFSQRLITDPEPSPYVQSLFGKYDGPFRRSEGTLALVREDLLQYNGQKSTIVDDAFLDMAVLDATNAFNLRKKVKPYHINDIMDMKHLDCMKSSPGIPWTNYRTRGDVASCKEARNSIRYFWHRIKTGKSMRLPDCKAFIRVHITKDEPKVRSVWGYPTTVTFAEAQFALPLIEAFQEVKTPIAYGYDMATGGARRLRNELPSAWHLCADFKRFDKTVHRKLIRHAFRILLQNIDFTKYNGRGVPDMRGLLRVWNKLVSYFINTPIAMCTGDRYLKTGGIPSGSFFTQIIDSIINYIVWKYVSLKTQNKIRFIRVFGDDAVVSFRDKPNMEELHKLVDDLGLILNTNKTLITDDRNKVEFLGFCIRDGRQHRDHEKWLAHLYYPEVPDRSLVDVQSRALGLFYANNGVNNEFDEMCRKIIHLRPFEPKFTPPFRRFLSALGIDTMQMTIRLPTHLQQMARNNR